MPTQRLTELPDEVLRLIQKASGRRIDVGTINAGLNSAIAARVHTADRTLFVKGLPLDHPRVWTQKREGQINPYVRTIAPELLWHIEDNGWSLLGFAYVDGRHADFTPTSSDLQAVMAAMMRLADVPAPALELKSMPNRFRSFVDDPADLSWFAGDSVSDQLSDPMRTVRSGAGSAHLGGEAWAWRWNPAPSAAPRGRCRLVVGVLIVVTLWCRWAARGSRVRSVGACPSGR